MFDSLLTYFYDRQLYFGYKLIQLSFFPFSLLPGKEICNSSTSRQCVLKTLQYLTKKIVKTAAFSLALKKMSLQNFKSEELLSDIFHNLLPLFYLLLRIKEV